MDSITNKLSRSFGLKYNEKAKYWYSEWNKCQRLVVHISCEKGTHDLIKWGYNYNFIPMINGKGKFLWHRTDNAFRIHVSDAWYNHIEYEPDQEWGLSAREFYNPRQCPVFRYEIPEYTSDLKFAINYVDEVIERNILLIQEWLESTETIEDAIVFLDEKIKVNPSWITGQMYYVKAFLHAYQNDLESAKEAMKGWYGQREIPQSVIEKLYQTAVRE